MAKTTKKVIGKGLSALLGKSAEEVNELVAAKKPGEVVENLAVDLLDPNPYQPRVDFNEAELQGLADSIKSQGLLQPVIVRKKGQRYELIAGERRLRATKLLGKKNIKAIVRSCSDKQSMNFALLENLQRMDLNPVEVAKAYQRLMKEGGLTQEELSSKLGVSRSVIANAVRILNMPQTVQDLVAEGKISETVARALNGLPNKGLIEKFAGYAVQNEWSARQAADQVASYKKMAEQLAASKDKGVRSMTKEEREEAIRQGKARLAKIRRERLDAFDAHLGQFVEDLEAATGEEVAILKFGNNTKYQIIGFRFATQEDVQRIYDVLLPVLQAARKQEAVAQAKAVADKLKAGKKSNKKTMNV